MPRAKWYYSLLFLLPLLFASIDAGQRARQMNLTHLGLAGCQVMEGGREKIPHSLWRHTTTTTFFYLPPHKSPPSLTLSFLWGLRLGWKPACSGPFRGIMKKGCLAAWHVACGLPPSCASLTGGGGGHVAPTSIKEREQIGGVTG